jgi:SAM-dependent methyltransferase
MNPRELAFFTEEELRLPDATAMPLRYLGKALLVKLRRRLLGSRLDGGERLAWTTTLVADASPASLGVRNYLDRCTLRGFLRDLAADRPLSRACELGCGYGRVTMVLQEFAAEVAGFEREEHLVRVASSLLPGISFHHVERLCDARSTEPFDLVLTCAVLQHLTDDEAIGAAEAMKRLAPAGHLLCVERTAGDDTVTGRGGFISRARPVREYEKLMAPYRLVKTRDRVVEPGFPRPAPGTWMLFASPTFRGPHSAAP